MSAPLSVSSTPLGSDKPPSLQTRSATERAGAAFSVLAIKDIAELETYLPSWDDLAAAAIEPNVFYESWMLLPALRAYGNDEVSVVLVFDNQAPRRHGKPLLCGLFPTVRQRRSLVPVLCLWHHVHCYLAVPLVRTGFGPGVLRALFEWLACAGAGAPLLECGRITGDGPFYHLLLEHVQEQHRALFVAEAYARAFLRNDGTALGAGLSGDKRRKLRRAEERLAASAALQYTALEDEGDAEAWLADFLRLEASGWKGRAGTALDCRPIDRQFFLEVGRAAFQRRRLMMLAVCANGRPIAQLCNFLAGEGSFAFKVAHDEAHASYSPGRCSSSKTCGAWRLDPSCAGWIPARTPAMS